MAKKDTNINFYLLSDRKVAVTGGHKYEKDLFEICEKIPKVEAFRSVVGAEKVPKILKPIAETFKSIRLSKGNVIIYNSSTCLRLLPGMLLLRLFTNKELYSVHHHFIYLEFKGLKRFVYKTAERLFLKSSKKIIVPSPYIYEELKKIKKEKDLLLWRIPFDVEQSKAPKPIVGNLTFAGTIEPRKGLIYLFEALNILREKGIHYKLNILGKVVNDEYYKKLREYAQKHNLNVEFLGFVEKDEKDRVLSETDIFVFPSLLEGFGMVLVEAQVYGLPIVSFDNSAMPFSVKDGVNGYAVKTGDSAEMAERIKDIITNRELREKLSQGALENLKDQWSFERFQNVVKDHFGA